MKSVFNIQYQMALIWLAKKYGKTMACGRHLPTQINICRQQTVKNMDTIFMP